MRNFQVRVICNTYNQEEYISQTLDGFCIQKTNFPFLCIIFEDASTDGEQEVIKNYMKKHFCSDSDNFIVEETNDYVLHYARHKTNENCYLASFFLKENHYSTKRSKRPYYKDYWWKIPYAAYCEGDDYWTDQLKLQKQVEGLEKNPNCSFSINKVNTVNREGKLYESTIPTNRFDSKQILTIDDYMDSEFVHGQWTFQLSGCMMRTEINHFYKKYLDTIFKKFPYGDIPLFLTALLHGDCYYISSPCGCYRRMSGGYTSSVASNPELRISNERKIISSYTEFDIFTNKKYHKYIRYRILRGEFKMALWANDKKSLLKLKFIPIYRKMSIIGLIKFLIYNFISIKHKTA